MKKLSASLVCAVLVAGCSSTSDKPLGTKVAFMPKLVGIPYFNACKKGAEEAAQELGIELTYNGPTETDVNKQIDLIKQWVASGEYNAICVACNEPDQIAATLRNARKKGVHVITYDADSQADARAFFVNQGTYDAIARAMLDSMAEQLSPQGEGKVGVLTSSRQAPNQRSGTSASRLMRLRSTRRWKSCKRPSMVRTATRASRWPRP